jgi:hypothetical protein
LIPHEISENLKAFLVQSIPDFRKFSISIDQITPPFTKLYLYKLLVQVNINLSKASRIVYSSLLETISNN